MEDVLVAGITALDGIVSNAGGRFVGASDKQAQSPTLTHNGRHYWATWVDHTPLALEMTFAPDTTIVGMRLDSNGSTLDGSPQAGAFLVSSYPYLFTSTNRVRVASNDAGKVLAAYTAFDKRVTARQRRVLARFLEDTPAEIDGGIIYKPDPVPDAGTGADASDASDAPDAGNDATSSGGAAGAGGQDASSTGGAGGTATGGSGGAAGAAGAGGAGGVAGTAGSGGSAGGAGAAAGANAGGSAGTAGNAGAEDSGSAGSGNAPAAGGGSGSPNDAGTRPNTPRSDPEESDGCGCRVASRSEPFGFGLTLVAGLLGLGRARRRLRKHRPCAR